MKFATRALGAVACALALALPAVGQAPAADWQTASTEHFRIHYPKESEAWALRAAARLESIRAAVVAEVGYEPPQVVDVFVSDPVAEPNGMALPLLKRPRMVLWTSPPDAGSILGHYRDWTELLAIHEETHLVHLLRPSRNRLRGLLPAGPLALLAPRWVSEGYATLVEGRLTGAGRPNGDLRAAVLRRWAAAGKLPSYDALASDREGYLGMSMAYLAGSAYLEWLERRAGPGSLKNLWARMSAREPRSFDESFRGVFAGPEGSSPRDLWDRFRAELSAQAIEIEKRLAPLREGELWHDLPRGAGAPALSPSGKLLALVEERRREPGELVVFATGEVEGEEAGKISEGSGEKKDRRASDDPEDVPAVEYGPLKRRPLYRLPAAGGRAPSMPRFLSEDEVLFVRFEPDGEGFLHPDLFVWTLASGRVRRITRGADLRDADPSVDGRWAVALRQRHGFSQIVQVDLSTGAVEPLTERSVEEIYDAPRLSRDGTRLAFLRHRATGWRLWIRELATGAERELPLPEGESASPSAPAWSADGRTIFASLGRDGRIDLVAFEADGPPEGDEPQEITRTAGAAFAPAPTPDGREVFYLSLEPQGLDLRRIALSAASAALEPIRLSPADLAPAVRPVPPAAPVELVASDIAPGSPYGFGRMEWLPLFGGSLATAGGNAVELGVRGGDPLGRFELLALGGLGGFESAAPRGASFAATYRGLPVEVSLRGFHLSERPSRANRPAPDSGLDLDRSGFELAAEIERRYGALWTRGRAGARTERIEPAGLERTESRSRANLEIATALDLSRGKLRFEPWLALWGAAGSGLRSRGGSVGVSLGRDSWRLDLAAQRGRVEGARFDFDRLVVGGVPDSLSPVAPERIEAPALAPGELIGDRYTGLRADLAVPDLPFHLLYERHRIGSDLLIELAGIERRFGLGPYPLAGLPAFEARAGAAQILDGPRPDEVGQRRGWLVLVWRPR